MATLATPHPEAPIPTDEVRPGIVLSDRYRIDALIGEGGAGRVFAAEHVLLRKKVAIKILRSDRANVPEMVHRFEREAMAAANIEHPNIASAIDFGRLADGSVFLALEFVSGRSLRQELAGGPLALGRSLRIARQIAAALAGAQPLGIVHRDLKPENVMLVQRGDDSDFVKVLDFGIARVPMADKAQPLTQAGTVFGTPAYMAPEQALGLRVDARADLYALGVMLFEMLTGSRPYSDQGVAQQFTEPLPSLASRGAQVPAEVESIVARLLARDVQQRIQTAEALIAELDAWLAQHAESGSFRAVANPVGQPRAQGNGTSTFMPGDPLPAFDLHTRFPDTLVPRPSVPVSSGVPRAELPPTSVPPQPNQDATESANTVAVAPAKPQLGAAATFRLVGSKLREEFASIWARLRARNAALLAESASFLDVQRKKLPKGVRTRLERVPSTTLVSAFMAVSSALLVIGVVALVMRSGSPRTAKLSVTQSSAVASARALAVPAASADEPTAQAVTPPAANADEESVLLELANSYTSERRDAEAVTLVQRVLLRRPELAKDARIAKILSRTARSDDRAASDQSFTLLEGSLGEAGAEVVYDLWRARESSERVRRRAESWIKSSSFDRVSSAPLYSAVKLRLARSCEQKHALLRLAADVGGIKTLEYLRELEQRTTCTAGQTECYVCLGADSLLKQTIDKVAARVGK